MTKFLLPVLAAFTFLAPTAEAAPVKASPAMVAASIASGNLTLAEAQVLKSSYENLQRVKVLVRADGRVTKAEKARLRRLEAEFARQKAVLMKNRVRR